MHGSVEGLPEYVAQVTGGASFRSIAAAMDMEPSTLSRQFARGNVPIETVLTIARLYHGDLLLALVAGGFITEDEAAGFTSRGTLAAASDLQIAQESLRRMRAVPRMDEDAADGAEEGDLAGVRRRLDALAGPHVHTRDFAPDAAASTSPVSISDEAVATENEP